MRRRNFLKAFLGLAATVALPVHAMIVDPEKVLPKAEQEKLDRMLKCNDEFTFELHCQNQQIADGGWHHYAIVRDIDGNVIEYFDGSQVDSGTIKKYLGFNLVSFDRNERGLLILPSDKKVADIPYGQLEFDFGLVGHEINIGGVRVSTVARPVEYLWSSQPTRTESIDVEMLNLV